MDWLMDEFGMSILWVMLGLAVIRGFAAVLGMVSAF